MERPPPVFYVTRKNDETFGQTQERVHAGADAVSGLAQNSAQIYSLFALANLVIAKRALRAA